MALILEVVSYQGNTPATPATKVFGARGGTLGRAPESDWMLADPEKYISGIHAVISCENGIYYLEDTSTNGVFINDTDEPLGKGHRVALKDGDLLYIGEYQISTYITEDQNQSTMLGPGGPAVGSDEVVATNLKRGDDINQVSLRHISYLDNEFGDNRNGTETTADYQVHDAATGLKRNNLDSSSGSIRSDQIKQESTENRAKAPLIDEPNLPDTRAIETPGQPTVVASSTDHLSSNEELLETTVKQNVAEERIANDWHEPIFKEDLNSLKTHGNDVSLEQTLPSSAVEDSISREVLTESKINQPEKCLSSESAGVMKAFLKGLGLKESAISTGDSAATMETAGVCFRELIQGVMDILLVRASLKKEFQMSATTVHPIENNPLKFAMGVDEALPYLLLQKHSSGFLPPVEAIREGIQDVQDHHWAIMVAMQAAFDDLLKQFDPEVLEELFAKDSKLGSLRKVNKMFRNWDSYCKYYESLTKDAHDSFQRLFAERFVHAYEDQIQRLSKARNRSDD